MDNYITILPTSCTNMNHIIRTFCLPEKTACDNTTIDGILTPCDDIWNCNLLCGNDRQYFIPLVEKFMIQTNFNTGKNPTSGWGTSVTAEMYSSDGTLISSNVADFASRYMVGHNGKYSFQNIELDPALIDVDCFYLKIHPGPPETYTQKIKKVECKEYGCLEAVYDTYDCCGNYYKPSGYGYVGTSNFAYSNRICLVGSFKYFGSNVTQDSITELVRFYSGDLLPPFMERYISYKLLKSKYIIFNGEVFNNKAQNLTPRERSNMFLPILEFEREVCSSKNSCK